MFTYSSVICGVSMSLLSNAKWNSFSQFFKIIIQMVNLVYLAKIIPPAEYGLMAMTAVVTSLGILLRDLGTASALIQKKELTEELKNTIFWLNTLMGFIISIVICASSHWVANLYEQPRLIGVLISISIIFPLSSCVSAHLALMERESMFKKISLVEISSSLTSVIVAIIMANKGYGVYSLVGQAVTLNLLSAVQFWFFSKWTPSFKKGICINELKGIFNFSANLSVFNFINYFSRNGDSFIIGKFMSPVILGNYNLAYRIMLFPLQSLTFVASRSLYPVLSKHQDDNKKIVDVYFNSLFVVFFITAPLMTGLALLSEPFVHIVFGNQWEMTAGILKWLAPTAIIQSILSTTGAVFAAKSRTDILLKLGVIGTILQFGSFIIGVHFTINIFAMLYLWANVINFFPVMFVLLRLIDGSLVELFFRFSPVVLATLIMVFYLKIIDNYMLPFSFIDDYYSLVIVSISGAVVYVISLVLFSKKIRLFFLKRRG